MSVAAGDGGVNAAGRQALDPDAPLTVPELIAEVARLRSRAKEMAAPVRVIEERVGMALDAMAEGRLYVASGMVRSAETTANVLVNAAHPEQVILDDLLAALAPVMALWACDHMPRLGVEVDPLCARCESMGRLRRAFAWAQREARPTEPAARGGEG